MNKNELYELRQGAYANILEQISKETDPEKLQKLANAVAQIEKNDNESLKVQNEYAVSQAKLEHEMTIREEERVIREEDKLRDERRAVADRRWKIFDSVLALAGCAAGIALAFKTKSEEEDSYPKHPKTDSKASQLFDRAWRKNR